MAKEVKETGLPYWIKAWDKHDIVCHKLEVHKMLQKHSSLLFKDGETQKFFVPLCGKTLDMKWLLDQGQDVVGLEGVHRALEEFCQEQHLEATEEDSPTSGEGSRVLKGKDTKLKLYCGDVFQFNKSVAGQFDCVWDRGSLVALDRKDVKRYAEILKDVLKPGGKIFVEIIEYDLASVEDVDNTPPPHPVFEDEVRSLYEPDCSVELVDKDERMIKGKIDAKLLYYLIVKK